MELSDLFWVIAMIVGSIGYLLSPERRQAAQQEREARFRAWLDRPLPEPPEPVDWSAFEQRVEHDLRCGQAVFR